MQVKLSGVHKYYNRGRLNEVHALKNIDLQIDEGETVCLMGPSGSGKSTLLTIIGCILNQTSGSVTIGGKQLSRMPEHFLTRHRRETVGFIFQRFHLLESLTVTENVELPLLPLGLPPKKRREICLILLEKLNIGHRQSFKVGTISGGEMQRVAIARALICDPPLLLADEPTAHLDKKLSLQFMDIMAMLKEEGRTIIFTSHDPLICSHPIVDRIVNLEDGQIVEQ